MFKICNGKKKASLKDNENHYYLKEILPLLKYCSLNRRDSFVSDVATSPLLSTTIGTKYPYFLFTTNHNLELYNISARRKTNANYGNLASDTVDKRVAKNLFYDSGLTIELG